MRAAKEKWVCSIAQEAEKAERDGCVRWKCIKKLQVVDRGRRPKTLSSVRNREGQLADNPAELRDCWHDHFSRVLNIPSLFEPVVWDTTQSSRGKSPSFKSYTHDKLRSFCPGHPNNEKITTWFVDTDMFESPNFLHFFSKPR